MLIVLEVMFVCLQTQLLLHVYLLNLTHGICVVVDGCFEGGLIFLCQI